MKKNILICVDEALVYPSSKKKIVIFDLFLQRFVFIFFFCFSFVLFCFVFCWFSVFVLICFMCRYFPLFSFVCLLLLLFFFLDKVLFFI